MDRITFQNEPNTTTPINATNLNQLQTNVQNEFNRIENYSTNEIVIGKWTDNKPIYRKTIIVGSTLEIGENAFAHGISNLGKVISHKTTTNNARYTLPYFSSEGKITAISNIDTTNVNILAQESWESVYQWAITIEYTKTTD